MTTEPTTTTDSQVRHELLARLRAVRRTGTAVAALAGLSQSLLAVLAAVLLSIGLDWLLRLPGPLRLALALILVVFVAVVLSRGLLARLRPPALAQVARQVQDSVQGPPDCLASGAEFVASGQSGDFVEQTISRSAQLARNLSPLRLARWRWMAAWLAGAALAVGVLAVSWPAIGSWVQRGLQRLAWPAEQVDWPRRVQIVSDLFGQTLLAAAGEPVTVTARVLRGPQATDARLVLEDAGQIRRLDMTDLGDGRRSLAVRLLGSATFWFEAGDDDTRATPGRIRVVQRPAVTRAEILVQPPAYTAQAPGRITLGSGPVQVPEGSRVDLQLTVSKPLAEQGGHPRATIAISPADGPDAQPVEALDVHWGRDHQQITAGWWCTRDSLVRTDFADTDGFANSPLQPWRLTAAIDQPPALQVQAPADGLEVTLAAVVRMQATAMDDFGIDDIRLAWRISRAAASQPTGPSTQPSLDQSQRIPTAPPRQTGQAVTLPIDWPWSLATLSLQPGDRLTWSLQVQDNFDLQGRRHEPVGSPPRTIRIVSESELLESLLQQLSNSRGRLVQMLQQQRDLRESLLAQAARQDQVAQADAALRRSLDQQARIAGQARNVAAELASAAQRLRTNRIERETLKDSVTSAGHRLSEIQSAEMADVQRNLQAAQQSAAAQESSKASELSRAAQAAAAAAQALDDLLQWTAGWTSLESAALGLQDLIDKQKALQTETADLASKTLGQPFDQLPPEQRDALARLAESQRALAQRASQWQKDTKAQSAGQSLPPDQQAKLDAAADTLEKQNAAAMMAAAAENAARNVTMDAQQYQQSARQAMQQALAALRDQKGDPQAGGKDVAPGDALARQLKQLAQKQATLRAQTGDINARRDASAALDRAGSLRLNQAGRGQADLAQQVQQAQLSAQGEAEQRLLEAVSRQMQATAGQMQSGSTGQPVLDAQQHAADTLSALADALERAAQSGQNSRNLAGQGQGKSGESGSKTANPAQVEVLYLLQQDLLFRTQHAVRTAAPPATVQQLGQEQEQLRDLAQRVLSQQ